MKIHLERIGYLQREIAKGNETAFKDLYRLFFDSLFRFASFYVNKKLIAEKIVNDQMVKISNKRVQMSAIQNLHTYLLVAVKNHSLSYLSTYSAYHTPIKQEGSKAKLTNRNHPQKESEFQVKGVRLSVVASITRWACCGHHQKDEQAALWYTCT